MLAAEARRANFAMDIRQQPDEGEEDYTSRLSRRFAASAAQVAWLCVPPGPHVLLMLQAALAAGLHVIVEKPWSYSKKQTKELEETARKRGLKIGVHFEYCLLSMVDNWRREYQRQDHLGFAGIFSVQSHDHLGISALENLGSHLLAIHAYAVPNSKVLSIQCDYESEDKRVVWLETGGHKIVNIDFLGSKEPIIQRFIQRFEASWNGNEFPFDLKFASRVAEDVAKSEKKQSRTTGKPGQLV